eukprot:PhM_4_TR16712/c0_g2_i1/m.34739
MPQSPSFLGEQRPSFFCVSQHPNALHEERRQEHAAEVAAAAAAAEGASDGSVIGRAKALARRHLRPGVVALFIAAFAFSAQIMFASVVSGTFSPFQVLYSRMFTQLTLSSVVLIKQRALPFPSGHGPRNSITFLALCGRGIMGVICLGGLYYSLQRLPVSQATVLYNMSPIFVTIFARIVFKDRITLFKLLAVALLLVGGALVTTNGDPGSLPTTSENVTDYVVVIIAAVVSACSILLGRRAAVKGIHFLALAWWHALFGASLLTLPSFFFTYVSAVDRPDDAKEITWASWVCLASVGLCSFTAQALMGLGMKREPPAIVAAIANFDTVFALMWQTTVFDPDVVGVWSWLGALVFVVASAMLVSQTKSREKQRAKKELKRRRKNGTAADGGGAEGGMSTPRQQGTDGGDGTDEEFSTVVVPRTVSLLFSESSWGSPTSPLGSRKHSLEPLTGEHHHHHNNNNDDGGGVAGHGHHHVHINIEEDGEDEELESCATASTSTATSAECSKTDHVDGNPPYGSHSTDDDDDEGNNEIREGKKRNTPR